MKGITQMHHFRFSADHPGVVFVKNASDDLKERKIYLLTEEMHEIKQKEADVLPSKNLGLCKLIQRNQLLFNIL